MSARTPSLKCRALLLDLSRYLDGELSPARRRAVEAHVDSCECCGTLSLRLRTVIAACRAEAGKRPPRAVMQRAAARIRKLVRPQ
jgi:anti-sigma factor RsiW